MKKIPLLPALLCAGLAATAQIPQTNIDLSIKIISSPRVAAQGQRVNLEVAYTLRGAREQPSVSVDLVLSRDREYPVPAPLAQISEPYAEDMLLKGGRETVHPSEGTHTFKLWGELPADLFTGGYYLLAVIDAGNRLQEKSEQNNVAWARLEVYDETSAHSWGSKSSIDIGSLLLDLNNTPCLHAVAFCSYEVDGRLYHHLFTRQEFPNTGIDGSWSWKAFDSPDALIQFVNADKIGNRYISEFDISATRLDGREQYWLLYRLSDHPVDNKLGWKRANSEEDLRVFANGAYPYSHNIKRLWLSATNTAAGVDFIVFYEKEPEMSQVWGLLTFDSHKKMIYYLGGDNPEKRYYEHPVIAAVPIGGKTVFYVLYALPVVQ